MRKKNEALVPLYPEGIIHFDGRIFGEVKPMPTIFISKDYYGNPLDGILGTHNLGNKAKRTRGSLGCGSYKYLKFAGCP